MEHLQSKWLLTRILDGIKPRPKGVTFTSSSAAPDGSTRPLEMLEVARLNIWSISTSTGASSSSRRSAVSDIAIPPLLESAKFVLSFNRDLPTPVRREPSLARMKGKGLCGRIRVIVTPEGDAAPSSRLRLINSNTAAEPRLQGIIMPKILQMTVPETIRALHAKQKQFQYRLLCHGWQRVNRVRQTALSRRSCINKKNFQSSKKEF
jgi:hypothetical protein